MLCSAAHVFLENQLTARRLALANIYGTNLGAISREEKDVVDIKVPFGNPRLSSSQGFREWIKVLSKILLL